MDELRMYNIKGGHTNLRKKKDIFTFSSTECNPQYTYIWKQI